jgi:hypothetical protein
MALLVWGGTQRSGVARGRRRRRRARSQGCVRRSPLGAHTNTHKPQNARSLTTLTSTPTTPPRPKQSPRRNASPRARTRKNEREKREESPSPSRARAHTGSPDAPSLRERTRWSSSRRPSSPRRAKVRRKRPRIVRRHRDNNRPSSSLSRARASRPLSLPRPLNPTLNPYPHTALVSRQYADMSRIRIEGLLAAFPKLVGAGKQHTYVETDSVRYVYQPMEVRTWQMRDVASSARARALGPPPVDCAARRSTRPSAVARAPPPRSRCLSPVRSTPSSQQNHHHPKINRASTSCSSPTAPPTSSRT